MLRLKVLKQLGPRLRSNIELHMRRTTLQFESFQTGKVRPLGQTSNLIQIKVDQVEHVL